MHPQNKDEQLLDAFTRHLDIRMDDLKEDNKVLQADLKEYAQRTSKLEADVNWLKRWLGGVSATLSTVMAYIGVKYLEWFRS